MFEEMTTERDAIFGLNDNNSPRWRSKEQNLQAFEGALCDKCGNTKRFTNLNNGGHHGGECLVCRAESNVRRRAAKIQRTPPWLTEEHHSKFREMIIERDRLTSKTNIPHHIDHIIPLQGEFVSGLHVPWNLQIIPASENCAKGNFFEDF